MNDDIFGLFGTVPQDMVKLFSIQEVLLTTFFIGYSGKMESTTSRRSQESYWFPIGNLLNNRGTRLANMFLFFKQPTQLLRSVGSVDAKWPPYETWQKQAEEEQASIRAKLQ